MDTYYTYNPIEKRMEIFIDGELVLSFPHDDFETGNAYLTFSAEFSRPEYWSGGVLVRSYS